MLKIIRLDIICYIISLVKAQFPFLCVAQDAVKQVLRLLYRFGWMAISAPIDEKCGNDI